MNSTLTTIASRSQNDTPIVDGRIITRCYISIQVSIALFISIIGAIHVNRCINEIKKAKRTNTGIEKESGGDQQPIHEEEKGETPLNVVIDDNIEITEEKAKAITDILDSKDNENVPKKQIFCKLWGHTVWKMRSVYSGLAVHSFDVLTDILVIIQWMQMQNYSGDHIDPKVMAYAGIAVLFASKIISTIAIFLKELNIRRAMLQFLDVLIFEELYESHKKIVSQIKNKKCLKDEAIESTLSFKYVRNFEAVFESIPQSVLQLVFIMRIPEGEAKYNPIFIISIIQSIISMTNSILNNDFTRMQDDQFKKYKQRLPPTFECFKHSLCRFSEVVYRIGLLALFWTVCEGLAFSIMLGIELALLLSITFYFIFYKEKREFSGDTFLLAINTVIVVPSEEVYTGRLWDESISDLDFMDYFVFGILLIFGNCCCCFGFAACLTGLVRAISWKRVIIDFVPTMRIAVSISELTVVILYGIYGQNGRRETFLLTLEHGLLTFIATSVCLLIYSQFGILFPDFSLPLNVNVRSKWGYAYSNELTELKKIKVRISNKPKKIYSKVYDMSTVSQFWDEPKYNNDRHTSTAAIFALAKENYDIVEWLEEQGAKSHKGNTQRTAAWMIGL